jgi:hypothetical protein
MTGYDLSEWEHINPKNLDFCLNNHDGLKWELFVSTKTDDGNIRGMPIGWIIQGDVEDTFKFITNPKDEKYSYRMMMSGKTILFFRIKRELYGKF